MTYRQTAEFLLHDWLAVETLTARPRFADHSRETFDSVLDVCEKLAREKFAPFNRLADTDEPRFDGERVHLPQATHDATRAYAESGMLAASQPYEVGGMQLPCAVEMAANSFFSKASIALGGYAMLTKGNARLLMAHGTPAQREAFAVQEFAGRFFGTMALSEPQAGSSLSDVATRATPDGEGSAGDPLGPRHRLRGSKMWISAGEHELAENIVHLVLAKIPGADGRLPRGHARHLAVHRAEVAGRARRQPDRREKRRRARRPQPQARLPRHHQHPAQPRRGQVHGARRGGRHRLPGRRAGRRARLHVPHDERGAHRRRTRRHHARHRRLRGLARLRSPAPAGPHRLGCRQGRDAAAGADRRARRREAHAARAEELCEGALALELYCARLVDEANTGDAAAAAEARLLLEMLTPIAKSFPSEWCLEANSLAIQVLGGYGYTRDFPVEQYWRDNRLNMIHEGTHGIQALDLLGRKVLMQEGRGLRLVAAKVGGTVGRARAVDALAGDAEVLARALAHLVRATGEAWATGEPAEALANATPYMQAFGHVVVGWIWLDVALCACAGLAAPGGRDAQESDDTATALRRGKLAAARYFFGYELPRVAAWLAPVETRADTCRTMEDAWF